MFLMGKCFPISEFQTSCVLLRSFCLSMCIIWHPDNLITVSVHRALLLEYRGMNAEQVSFISCREAPAGHWGLTSTTEADLALSLLVSKAFFHPVLDCSIFPWRLQYQDAVVRSAQISTPDNRQLMPL